MSDEQTERMITIARHCIAYELTRDRTVEQLVHVYGCDRVEAFYAAVAAEILERHGHDA